MTKHCYSISKFKTFSHEQAKEIFPDNFRIKIENGKYFLIVETMSGLDRDVFIEVQKECDRIFFLTGEQLNPQFEWKKNDDGVTTRLQSFRNDFRCVEKIPDNSTKQQWTPCLTVQLRLWQLAKLPDLPIAAMVNLLFQIVEIAFPDKKQYPKYVNSNIPPDSKRESFLLRDLVSHSGAIMYSDQLKEYCKFLNIERTFHDPTDVNFTKAIRRRFNIVEDEARKVISEQITLNE
ncbi:MAG: hypothetical protein P9M13_07850 [Candidatus Ancaeobacter aquaticus]|nr:hypothetical protein [Candidatus Ancaeobacter aquaticus]